MRNSTDQPKEAFAGVADDFHRALDAADIGLWRWDLTTGIISLSRRAVTLFGCSGSQPLNYAEFIGVIHPDDRPAADKELRRSIAAIGPFDFIVRTVTRAGRVRVRGTVFGVDGQPTEANGILIDSVRRTAAEIMSNRLAAIVTSSDDAIIGKSLDGIVTDWNSGAEAIFGYTAAEAIGSPLSMLLPPGQEDEMAHILERIKAGERVEHYETRRRRKDGRDHRRFADDLSGVRDSAGRLSGASKVARDITATKRAQVDLRGT